MSDELTIINNLLQEHAAIQGHMKSVSALGEDWKGLDGDLTALNPEQLQFLNYKILNLIQTMGYLEEGLNKHWENEEIVLPELFGNLLLKSLRIEHDSIRKQILEINSAINKSDQQEILSNREHLKKNISHLCQLIIEHEAKETTMLELLKMQFV